MHSHAPLPPHAPLPLHPFPPMHLQYVYSRLKLYTRRYGYIRRGKVFRGYLFGHEFLVIGDVNVMKKMLTQVRGAPCTALHRSKAGDEDGVESVINALLRRRLVRTCAEPLAPCCRTPPRTTSGSPSPSLRSTLSLAGGLRAVPTWTDMWSL